MEYLDNKERLQNMVITGLMENGDEIGGGRGSLAGNTGNRVSRTL